MKRHIIACIKSVMLDAPSGRAVRTSETCDLNPFDRPSLAVALHLRQVLKATVTAVSMGPDACGFVLRDALAMGADRGILLSDPAFAGSDTLATTAVLAAAVKKLAPFDVLLFGTRTSDSDTGQVGPQTAVLLNLPMVTDARFIETGPLGLRVSRSADGFFETFDLSFPAALTIHPASVEPADPGLSGIAAAYDTARVEKWTLKDLGLTARQVGSRGSPTRVVSLTRVKRERKCEMISGAAEEQAEVLLQKLIETGAVGQ